MFRRMFIGISAVLLVLAVGVGPSFAWKFASIADSRGSTNGVNVNELAKIVTRINSENVDLVIFQGDAVSGTNDESALSSQMDTWLSEMKKLRAPWYYAPGNHEISTPTAQENVLRAKVEMPMNGPDGDKEMVYSFNYKNAHFVALNSNHYGQSHHVQLNWLANDLKHTNQPHVFVMDHEPAFPAGPHLGSSLDAYPTEREDLWRIMTTGHVSMFFCGHEHLYQRTKHDSIYQVMNGSCGAPLYTGVEATIAKYDYVIVDIEGNKVSCKAKDDRGAVLDQWSYEVNTTKTRP